MGYTDFWKSSASLSEMRPLVRFISRMAFPRRRWYSKADEERQKDTQHTDHGAVTENFHISLLIRNMRG